MRTDRALNRTVIAALSLSLLVPAVTQAALSESLIQSTFASIATSDPNNWYSNSLATVAKVPGGYLAVGTVEVQEPTQANWTVDTALYAYRMNDGLNLSADATFGTIGKLKLSLPAGNLYRAPSVVVHADGSFIVAAELAVNADHEQQKIIVAKFAADGAPDTAFGDGADGSLELTMPCSRHAGPPAVYTAQAPQLLETSDGRLVVTGSTNCDGQRQGFVTRLSASGVQETSWGSSGYLLLQPSLSTGAVWLTAAALTSDGKLLVSGITNGYQSPWVARITLGATPALDASFGNDAGYQLLDPVTSRGDLMAMAITANGRIVLGVSQYEPIPPFDRLTSQLVRLLPSGALDTSFSADGIAELNPGDAFTGSSVGKILPLSDGKLLVAGALDDRRALVLLDEAGAPYTANTDIGSSGYWQTVFTQDSRYLDVMFDAETDQIVTVGLANTDSATGSVAPNELSDDSFVVAWFNVTDFVPAATTGGGGGSGGGGGGSFQPLAVLLLSILALRRRVRVRSRHSNAK